jgi:hypothetical protein
MSTERDGEAVSAGGGDVHDWGPLVDELDERRTHTL